MKPSCRMPSEFTILSPFIPETAPSCLGPLPRFAKTSAILWSWCETDASSAAARFISMASISRKYAPSLLIPPNKARGGGKRLVKALLDQAKKHRVTCICLFTRKPEFFSQLGFAVAQREDLPDKIHKDCCVCPRFHFCDEVAMVRGELPKFAILPEPTRWLVKLQV